MMQVAIVQAARPLSLQRQAAAPTRPVLAESTLRRQNFAGFVAEGGQKQHVLSAESMRRRGDKRLALRFGLLVSFSG